jgi:hypothetical protein
MQKGSKRKASKWWGTMCGCRSRLESNLRVMYELKPKRKECALSYKNENR